ncbi:MAG: primosomal protein N' [Bacteroidales bacterium]|nr:primosomal protein N' [Bacteroidales bacterium]
MDQLPLLAEIIIPVALKGTFTYLVPVQEQQLAVPGMRVVVQFGKNKLYSGIMKEIHTRYPEHFEPKPIISFLDDKPVISEVQLQTWNWIANYYMCTIGEVMNAALPAGMKLASETVFRVHSGDDTGGEMTEIEEAFLEFIREEEPVSLQEIRKGPFGDGGIKLARKLADKHMLTTDQQMKHVYRPKILPCIDLAPEYDSEGMLQKVMDEMSRAPSQLKALEAFVGLSAKFDDTVENNIVTRQKLASAGGSPGAISALIKKGIFQSFETEISRIETNSEDIETIQLPTLTADQQQAIKSIREAFLKLPVVLLHGVTSSGKTEIYIQLIHEQIEKGNQVLYLLPEIAITTQIINRLKKVFGNRIGVYHSKYSDSERVEVYRNLTGMTEQEPYSVILGVRSAVFLPFEKLGLIIIDEEHENTYKQFDPAPRYHARDTATILGLFTGAKVLMGSATPSFESLYNTRKGKYGLATLNERYGKVAMPEIVIADVANARKQKRLKSHFTPELLSAMEQALSEEKQVILFQNRRGYSNYLQCSNCNYILKCSNCDVSLTYHKYKNEMICHYCGLKMALPRQCPECNETSLLMRGFGTEKIEDEIGMLFSGITVSRLDIDRSGTRKAYEKVIDDFENGKTRILVGTQMVTKGLDFENVSLVGIIDADSMLNFPDFRAFERSFQLMVQVSGRSGRRGSRGKVVIQTVDPTHPVIQHVLNNDFTQFLKEQMDEREMFRYPPFVRLIRISLRHEIPSILDGGAVFLTNELKEVFGSRVLGPQQPLVARTHGKYAKQIILKIEKDASFEKAKELIGTILELFGGGAVYKQIRATVDVDPL